MRTNILPFAFALFCAPVLAQEPDAGQVERALTAAVRAELGQHLDSTWTLDCAITQLHAGDAGSGGALVMHRAPRVWMAASCTLRGPDSAVSLHTPAMHVNAGNATDALDALTERLTDALQRALSSPNADAPSPVLAKGN